MGIAIHLINFPLEDGQDGAGITTSSHSNPSADVDGAGVKGGAKDRELRG
jgi:hypothetical protein